MRLRNKLVIVYIFYWSDSLKPKRKPLGVRSSNPQIINEKNLEQNIRNEIAKEIKPNKPK